MGTIARYGDYRDYEHRRIETNNTMMALLASSQIARQTLSLTLGSHLTLGQIFPSIPHVQRFNLRSDRAQDILSDAEQLLGVVCVPQILAIQEALVKSLLVLLAKGGSGTLPDANSATASNVHERFEGVTGALFTKASLELFHLLRVGRNSYIHSGGRVSPGLMSRASTLSGDAVSLWGAISKSPLPLFAVGNPVPMGLAELTVMLAVTKRLAEESNIWLQIGLPRIQWIELLRLDIRGIQGNPEQRLRKTRGIASMHYSPLRFSEAEMMSVLV